MEWYAEDADDPLAHRIELIAKYDVYTYDLLISRWRCDACARAVEGPPAMAIPLVPYRSLATAEETLRRSLAGALAAEDAAPDCDCGRAAQLERVDYHFFHSRLKQDIVLRVAGTDVARVERLAWSPSGYAPLALDDAGDRVIARDALLRAAKAFRDHDEHLRLVSTLTEALATIPGEPELMRFAPRLVRIGAQELVLRLADAQMRHNPENAAGYYWSGQIVLEAAMAGHDVAQLMPGVVTLFTRAVTLQPDYPDAEIGLANLARLRHDAVEAERRLREMLARHPQHPEGNYTLGLVLLPSRPAEALDCFAAGEAASPDDADYPRSRARALLALGRAGEALAAAQKAKLLAPRDRRVDAVIAECLAPTRRTT